MSMSHRLLPVVAIVLGSLAAGCADEDQQTQSRQPSTYPTATRPVSPGADMAPPPQDMPGGGRGSEPPHSKGKP